MNTRPLILPGPTLLIGIAHLLAVEARAEDRFHGWRSAS